MKCFIQVKTSSEESKQGLAIEEVVSFIQSLQEFDKIEVVGLMTMAPFTEEEEEIDAVLKLRMLQTEVQELELLHAPCKELSMGMSNDYTIAIEEGLHIFVWERF